MTFDEYLLSDGVLNIFVDASITKYYEKTYGCPGGIVVYQNKIIDTNAIILEGTTNNRAELNAIYIGLQFANKYRNTFPNINIFSDSRLCVYSFTQWIYSWLSNSVGTIITNKEGMEVKNQDLILRIARYITDNRLEVNLFHQKGHVVHTEKSMSNARAVFIESNGIYCELDTITWISGYNEYIDKYTKQCLNNYEPVGLNDYPVRYYAYDGMLFDLQQYLNNGEGSFK